MSAAKVGEGRQTSGGASMTFRLPAELHAAFLAACAEADVSAAQVLRAAIRDFIAGRAGR